jgi:hypothetical protein
VNLYALEHHVNDKVAEARAASARAAVVARLKPDRGAPLLRLLLTQARSLFALQPKTSSSPNSA